MSFERWDFPGGQEGSGGSAYRAAIDAIGRAINTGSVQVRTLAPGSEHDLTLDNSPQNIHLSVLTGDLALSSVHRILPPEVWCADDLSPEAEPHITILPEDGRHQWIYRGGQDLERGDYHLLLYCLVRHVESTPSWTRWLPPESYIE
jgi:hypothetical protein